ncbi:UNVERIFIED_CONTAM: hypothetical protein HHA_297450 [Hammondia hammondi]|eukprot:XP_008886107.1 hypothetical protein HHA_297450 [Hammondia hammondi]
MERVRNLTGGAVEAMQEVDISELSFLDSFQSDDCSDLLTLSLPMSSFYFLHDAAFPLQPIVTPCSTEHPFPQQISQVSRRKKLPLSCEGLPAGRPSVEGKAFFAVPPLPPPSCLSPAIEPYPPTPSLSIPSPIKKGLEPNGPASVKAPSSPPQGHAEGDRTEEGRRRAETTGEKKDERRSRNVASEKRDSGTTSALQLLVAPPTRKVYSSVGSPGDGAAVYLKKMEIKPHVPSVSSKLQALRSGEKSLGSSSPSRIGGSSRFRSDQIVEYQWGSQKVSGDNVLDGTSTLTHHRCFSSPTRERRDNFARFGHENQRDETPFRASEAEVAGRKSLLDRLRAIHEIRPHAAEAAASLAISGQAEIGKRLSYRRSGREGDLNALELEMPTHGTSSHNSAHSPLNYDRQQDRNIRDIREQVAAVRDQLQRLPKTRKAQNAVARWKLVQELQTLEEQEKLLMERSLAGGVR